MRKIDPATLEIVRGAFIACSNEMGAVLSKTAYNPMVFEVQDFCIAIIDPKGQLIAQNSGGLPIFLADMGATVTDGIEKFGISGFEPGDAIAMNAPYVCGQHLNNVVVYTPCFADGELVAFPAVRAHWLDVGGRRVGFGSVETTEIYEEGLQLRSIKVYRGGKLDENIWQIIADNVRFPESCLGDLAEIGRAFPTVWRRDDKSLHRGDVEPVGETRAPRCIRDSGRRLRSGIVHG
ncbi:MAG: hydantoinase B/oxoprolinase family protein [Deltaproteobacteria bacterium]|nr:MAG: hydantoinase B/oxoprolinase family protein [Deltaproteobacteria bacterium]